MSKKCQCGKELLPEWKYCPECGHDLYQDIEYNLTRAEELYLVCKALLRNDADFEFVKALSPEEQNDISVAERLKRLDAIHKIAFKYCKKAAELKHPEAELLIARLYQLGTGTEHNYKEAINILKKYAENGNATAQVALGAMYLRGDRSVEKNLEEAAKWYKLAAGQGNLIAISVLKEKFNINN